MPAPYDYSIGDVPNPAQSFLQGIQMVDALRKREQDMAAAQAAQQQLQQRQMFMQKFMGKIADQSVTASDYQQMMVIDPANYQALKAGLDAKTTQEKETAFSNMLPVYSSLFLGKPETATKLIDTQIAAAENVGDTAKVQQAKQIRDLLATPEGQQQLIVQTGATLNGIDSKRFGEIQANLNTQASAGATRRKAEAEAGEAESKQGIKAIELKFAPEKFAADLGLTQAQIDQAKAAKRASDAAANASGAAARRANAEAQQMTAGIIPVEKRPEAEGKFRKEYSDQTKGYQEVKSAYGRVLASQETAAGDLALIFNYMKMLDPGSVVREGEFATAQNATGVPERIQNLYNNLVRGERLNPDQRKMFSKQAEGLYKQAQTQEATVRSGIERIAKGYGLNTDNIFYTPTEVAPTVPEEQRQPGVSVSVKAPNGQVLTFPSQQAADAFKKAAGIR